MNPSLPVTPCTFRDIKGALGHRTNVCIYSCCVLHNFETDEYEAYAVVNAGEGGREVAVRGWSVFLLNPEAPLSQHVRECRLGDIFLCYQVVSVNGSPILSEADRVRLYWDLKLQERDDTTVPDGLGKGAAMSRR
jgi:hypothetical protein